MAVTYPKGRPVAQRWPERTLAERIAEKITVDENGCHIWTAYVDPHGYGKIGVDGKTRLAHRVNYTLVVGPIPDGLTLDHLCRNRACVNPAHLEPVTLAENKARGNSLPALNARKTHCSKGHLYDEENTVIAGGGRRCRRCLQERGREQTAARRASKTPRTCEAEGCTNLIPASARSHKRACSERCRDRMRRARAAA